MPAVLGDCYRSAATFVTDACAADVVLCHGIPLGTPGGNAEGKRFGHAWVEIGEEYVIDIANGKEARPIDRAAYYEAGRIKPRQIVRYTWQEASVQMLRTGHFGPWDPMFDDID